MSKITLSNIFDFTETFAPVSTAMNGDNCGILVGNPDLAVTKAVVSLDITADVIDEAVAKGAELIISHHPVIFNPLKKLRPDDVVYKLVKNNIAALCLHTNLDLAPDYGVNVTLAKTLGLKNIQAVDGECLLTGELEAELSPKEFAQDVKAKLNCKGLSFTKGKNNIKKVAVGCGAAGEYIFMCKELGAQAFVTGELKHHEIIEANRLGTTAVVAGHYRTEDVVIAPLAKLLSERFPEAEFVKSAAFSDNVYFI